jgi:hypothetical protein
LVPVKNGAIPDAPEGGHSSQAGTVFELAAVPRADEPPEATPPETPAGRLLEPAAPFNDVAVPGNVTAPEGFVGPVPAMPEVWAAADSPKRTENSNTM